jgi:hypothetical protein
VEGVSFFPALLWRVECWARPLWKVVEGSSKHLLVSYIIFDIIVFEIQEVGVVGECKTEVRLTSLRGGWCGGCNVEVGGL